jgi:GntR family transcriptional regulator/MocR family aminotransferase
MPTIQIDRSGGVSIQRQIYDVLRSAILDGRLGPGTRLPATRALAGQLGSARITVDSAYAQLRAEGYLESRTGDGTYVSLSLPQVRAASEPRDPAWSRTVLAPSRRGLAIKELWLGAAHPGPRAVPFQIDVPAFDAFPIKVWRRLEARRLERAMGQAMAYSDQAGHRDLRVHLAAHLQAHRGMACDPEQVVITHGSQQALDLAAQILLDPGDQAWIEDPVRHEARTALALAGAAQVPVRVDGQGLDVASGEALAPAARVAYVCPSNQFPLGFPLSLKRRLALLDWAARADACVIEDDADGEFRYSGRPLASLFGLDRDGRVVFVGTFSHSLFPGLRLGYAVLPRGLVAAFTAALSLADRGGSPGSQMPLADFLAEGHYQRHLLRMRKLYGQRRLHLAARIRETLGHALTPRIPGSGLHLVADLAPGYRDVEVAAQATRLGIAVEPLSRFYQQKTRAQGLVFGFAGFPEEALGAGVERLASLFRG